MKFLKPELLIIVPFLIGVGEISKKKIKKEMVPFFILGLAIFLAAIYGLVTTTYTGWKFWADALIFTGVLHGAVAGFCAMGLYDTAKSGAKRYESAIKM